ncbi:MAG: hypothetical protein JSV62_15800 [Promethearchaeota archaeon]|nr:MAG: hypothetical protein JSV62_15800 [Candidatus Lokiarchaeota archaeon]
MYSNPDDPRSEYEESINKLTDQITELFSKIHFYQALLAEKDHQITQLSNENHKLKAQIQDLTHEMAPPTYPSQQSYTPPPIPKPLPRSETTLIEQATPTFTTSTDPRINKRVCPNCGAMGFAIREIDDKSNVISYIPRRIYAKKKSCTKCRYEW